MCLPAEGTRVFWLLGDPGGSPWENEMWQLWKLTEVRERKPEAAASPMAQRAGNEGLREAMLQDREKGEKGVSEKVELTEET